MMDPKRILWHDFCFDIPLWSFFETILVNNNLRQANLKVTGLTKAYIPFSFLTFIFSLQCFQVTLWPFRVKISSIPCSKSESNV